MKNQCEGQLNLFDFLKEENPIDTNAISEREILKGSGFSNGKTRIYNYFKEGHSENEKVDFLKNEYGIGGWSTEEGFLNHDAKGIDIKFDKPIGKTTEIHIGWMMVARRIDALIEKDLYKPNVCKFSGHTCNKEELWEIAESLDDPFCPHICCRTCSTRLCGARCNGSEEPQKAAEPECTKAKECEAYPTGCGGRIEPCRFGGPFKWSEKAQEVEIRGICDDGYCPKCKIWLDDLVERCPECNTLLDWTHWKRLNDWENKDD